MSDQQTPTPSPTPSPEITFGMIARLLMSFLNSAFVRLLLGSIVGGATAGYTVSYSLTSALRDAPKGILPKIFPEKRKAEDAIGKLRMGNVSCTGTIVGPVNDGDPEIHILTAAHCIHVGQTGTMTLKDGRTFAFRCVSRDAQSDAAWLKADRPGGVVPYLLLADSTPPAGQSVWHMGYGVDRPGNKEIGVTAGKTADGSKCVFRLNVSPGDSGGWILLTSTERIISPVCCTTRLAGMGEVYGATPERCRAIRPTRPATNTTTPLRHPILIHDEPPLATSAG